MTVRSSLVARTLLSVFAGSGGLALAVSGAAAQGLPPNPEPSCTVSSTLFSTWFKSGSPSNNGVVEPANSVAFLHQNNCQFYQWSEQMFLWLTSPAPPEYGGGNTRIYSSPVFFSLTPPDANGKRTMLPNDPLGPFGPFGPRPIGVRKLQKGAGGRLLVFTKSGEIATAALAPPGAKPTIRDAADAKVEVAHAARLAGGELVLKNLTDEVIRRPVRPQADAARLAAGRRQTIPTLMLTKFVVDKLPIFVDAFGNVVDVEPGQADGSVLLSQNNSLVYYTISTNDVYAYFLTGLAAGASGIANQFPITQTQLNAIVAFAATKGKTFPDPNALTVEVKAAWVEAAGLPNLSSYLTVTATVPTYDTSSASLWTVIPGKTRTIQLALVGMHVVGSVAGHPEMVWATFEHVANDPRAQYKYLDASRNVVTVPPQSGGPWTFSATNSSGPFNNPHASVSGTDIAALTPYTTNASDTMHLKPFGAALDTSPNPEDKTAAASNSEIISINNSVRGQLVGGDVRGNYVFSGATWTDGGAIPSNTNQIGTSMLANSTMETYQQGQTNADAGSNCFSCHTNTDENFNSCGATLTTCVSHVFSSTKPLP